jgi:hypothetical protein
MSDNAFALVVFGLCVLSFVMGLIIGSQHEMRE